MITNSIKVDVRSALAPVCLAATLAMLLLLPSCSRPTESEAKTGPDEARTAPVVRVTRKTLGNQLEIASEFQPFQEIDVYAKVSGYIQKLYVDYGTHVKKGQLLAVLEIPELQQQLQQDEAAVHRSEQDLARAHEELNRAQSAYTVAHLTYTRLADVQKSSPELVAQQEVDVAKGKDLEASAGVSLPRRTRWPAAEQGLASGQSRARKDQGPCSTTRA